MSNDNMMESERQEEYIKRCQIYVSAFEAEHGRLPKACVVTFGCQMNARDSEKLCGILEKAGYALTDSEEEADFVLYNTCTVRDLSLIHI